MSLNSEAAVYRAISAEIDTAASRFGRFRSTHEVYGVLAEEVYELLDAIHKNDPYRLVAELLQVAAVATRAAIQFDDGVAEVVYSDLERKLIDVEREDGR